MGMLVFYAVIPTGREVVFDAAGLGDGDPKVYSIPHGDLAAVVSTSPLVDYRGLRRDDAVRYLLAHQRVLETVMQRFPVLPVKFCTVVANPASVCRILEHGEAVLRAALEAFAARLQMEIVVLWNVDDVFHEIGEEEPIALLKSDLAGRSAEETASQRVALGRMVKESLEWRRNELRDRLLEGLRAVARDVVINPVMDDRMVANVALLIDKSDRDALDRRLEELDRALDGRLNFRCIGPLPPCSFATVETEFPSFEAVDHARRVLELGGAATPVEIKSAYHDRAGRFHPDHNPAESEAETRMSELTEAYRLLMAYADGRALAEGRTQSPEPRLRCSFDRAAVEQTVLIAVRRQEAPTQGINRP